MTSACRQHAVSMPRPCHELAVKGIFVAWQGNGMVCVNQTRPHCVNQMEKSQSKPLAERHGMCESALNLLFVFLDSAQRHEMTNNLPMFNSCTLVSLFSHNHLTVSLVLYSSL